MTQKTDPEATDEPLVLVVDDDEHIREALCDLLRSVGIDALCFASTQEFLHASLPNRPGCLVLDVRLPGLSGLEFQRHLASMGNPMPIVFMTGFGDVPMTVRAMKAGASDFLTKPLRDQDMLDAVAGAIEKDRARRRDRVPAEEAAAQAATLTPREREVMSAVVRGLMNKQIAGQMGISEVTVKLHRGNVMRKMHVRSVADLVRKVELLGLP